MDDISTMLRDSAAAFLSERHDLARLRGAIGSPRPVDLTLWREMGDLGWLALELPEALGGGGLGLRQSTVLAEEFGRAAFPAPYVAASVMPAVVLSFCARDAAGRQLCGALQRGEFVLTVAWQELLNELDARFAGTRLENGRVSGIKRFVPAAQSGGTLLVSVRDGEGPAIVAVAADADGVSVKAHAAGLGTTSEVQFTGAAPLFGKPLLRGREAAAALARALDAGRVALSAYLAGLAAGMLERTVAHVTSRVQFGRPIGSFQAIQHRCVDLYIETRLAGASWREALLAYEHGGMAVTAISAAKARCADCAQRVGREAIQMHGAMGFTEEAHIGHYVRAVMYAYAWLGTPFSHRRRFLAAYSAEPADG
jgi:alkylation response protein AidB-like acyl-CoA dehydrogenase